MNHYEAHLIASINCNSLQRIQDCHLVGAISFCCVFVLCLFYLFAFLFYLFAFLFVCFLITRQIEEWNVVVAVVLYLWKGEKDIIIINGPPSHHLTLIYRRGVPCTLTDFLLLLKMHLRKVYICGLVILMKIKIQGYPQILDRASHQSSGVWRVVATL